MFAKTAESLRISEMRTPHNDETQQYIFLNMLMLLVDVVSVFVLHLVLNTKLANIKNRQNKIQNK